MISQDTLKSSKFMIMKVSHYLNPTWTNGLFLYHLVYKHVTFCELLDLTLEHFWQARKRQQTRQFPNNKHKICCINRLVSQLRCDNFFFFAIHCYKYHYHELYNLHKKNIYNNDNESIGGFLQLLFIQEAKTALIILYIYILDILNNSIKK